MGKLDFLRKKRFWVKVAVAFATVQVLMFIGLYLFMCPRLNEPLVNSILFHPNHREQHDQWMMTISNVKAEEVSIPVGDAVVNGLFYKVDGAPDVVLFSHGNASDINNRFPKIKAMIDCGISVLAYDYRGYGKSTGEPSIKGVIEDGTAAYDFLTNQKYYTAQNIVLYGESVGTGVSTEIARKRECKAIILESGFTSPERRAKEKISFLNLYPSFLMMDPTLDNLDYARGKHPPLLLFAGKLDTMIPSDHSETIFAQATEPKELVIGPNSSHNDFSQDWKLYTSSLEAFIKKLMTTTSEGETKETDDLTL